MALSIREATPEEHAEAGRITAESYREFFGEGRLGEDDPYLARIGDVAGRADRTTILIAVEGGRIVGTLTLELEGRIGDKVGDPALAADEAHVRMLGVAPAARARGVGTALMAEAEARARAGGKTHVTLNTTRMMTAAQRMYERLGYTRQPDDVLPDGFVLLSYRKDLSPSTT